ncbi:hypothetical protein M1146_05525 [Patescibacteria group bacterium]|nr:hypothetical protein [Patescibacteria group bacterium]
MPKEISLLHRYYKRLFLFIIFIIFALTGIAINIIFIVLISYLTVFHMSGTGIKNGLAKYNSRILN